MPKFESSVSYAVPAVDVFNSTAQAVENLRGWRLKEVNQQGWYITAAVGFSFWSYGENISIQVSEPSPGQPVLGISSTSLFAIFDFGKNRRNVSKFLVEVGNILAQAGYAQAAAPAPQPQQPSGPGHMDAPASNHCPNCGRQLAPGARFCTGCGHQMPGR